MTDGSPSGSKEIDQAEAWIYMLERETHTAQIIDLASYRLGRASRRAS